jgi:hypothetical protein
MSSGHKTLSEVQRYTDDADRKRLAASGMAELRDQNANSSVANLDASSGKPAKKAAKNGGLRMTWRSREDSNLRPSV